MRQDYQGFGVVLQDDASDATHSTDYIQFYVDHIMPPDLQKRVRGKKGGGGVRGTQWLFTTAAYLLHSWCQHMGVRSTRPMVSNTCVINKNQNNQCCIGIVFYSIGIEPGT